MTTILLIAAFHLAALAKVESNNNHLAFGRSGERTEYQILPIVLAEHGLKIEDVMKSPEAARVVAQNIWQERVNKFFKKHGRNPNQLELYTLWNKPEHAYKLKPTVRDRMLSIKFESVLNDNRNQLTRLKKHYAQK